MTGWDMKCLGTKGSDLCSVLVWLHPTLRGEMTPEREDRGVGVCVIWNTLHGSIAGASQASSNVTIITS